MQNILDRVKETTTTTGTGTLTLAGAALGFRAFSVYGTGTIVDYCIQTSGGSEWEVGRGTVGSGTLTRDLVYASSNSGALVNLSAGTKDVFTPISAVDYMRTRRSAGMVLRQLIK